MWRSEWKMSLNWVWVRRKAVQQWQRYLLVIATKKQMCKEYWSAQYSVINQTETLWWRRRIIEPHLDITISGLISPSIGHLYYKNTHTHTHTHQVILCINSILLNENSEEKRRKGRGPYYCRRLGREEKRRKGRGPDRTTAGPLAYCFSKIEQFRSALKRNESISVTYCAESGRRMRHIILVCPGACSTKRIEHGCHFENPKFAEKAKGRVLFSKTN